MTEETDKTYRLRQRRPQHIFSVSRSKHVAFEGDRLVHADNPEHAAWRVIFASSVSAQSRLARKLFTAGVLGLTDAVGMR